MRVTLQVRCRAAYRKVETQRRHSMRQVLLDCRLECLCGDGTPDEDARRPLQRVVGAEQIVAQVIEHLAHRARLTPEPVQEQRQDREQRKQRGCQRGDG